MVRRSVYTLFTNFVNNLYYVNTFVMQTNRFRQQQQTVFSYRFNLPRAVASVTAGEQM